MSGHASISVTRLAGLAKQGQVELVDVRTPVEFQEVHVVGAKNVPLDALDPHTLMKDRNGSADDPLYLICKGGTRGDQACRKLIDAGYDNVVNVEGGTQAWADAGLAVIRGKKTVSLERQVRITAGTIVLVSNTLAMTIHPYFAGFAAFVGAGLAFAGITDTCGMAMLLAKMPWNRVTDETQHCTLN